MVLFRCFVVTSLLLGLSSVADAWGHNGRVQMDRGARFYNRGCVSWHAPYAHTNWGAPVALVVPPNAGMQTNYSWGVARTRMTPIYHQFQRPIPMGRGSAGRLSATPIWPSDTNQFGIYSVRAPW